MSTDTQKLEQAHVALSQGGRSFSRQLADMMTFLDDPDFAYSHREEKWEHNPTFIEYIRDNIRQFAEFWKQLTETVHDIVPLPSQVLERVVQQAHVGQPFRLNLEALRRNLREGRLQQPDSSEAWQLNTEMLWVEQEETSIDTAENAYVLAVWNRYSQVRTVLTERMQLTQKQFAEEAEHKCAVGQEEAGRRIAQWAKNIQELLKVLEELPGITFPDEWRSLTSRPTRNNNRVRYDVRYQRVAQLSDELNNLDTRGVDAEWRSQLRELGQRRPWEIYEFWMIAKVCELLQRGLNFEPQLKQRINVFHTLIDHRGARYGLREGASIHFRHGDLVIKLTVQHTQKEGAQRPDLRLDIVGGITAPRYPLILDAKCKNFTNPTKEVADDLEGSARRYAAQQNATAFLLHPGILKAWPAKGPEKSPLLEEKDYPFRHGIEVLRLDDDRMLRRIFTAWLVRHGIFWICFQCGHSHQEGFSELSSYPPISFSEPYPWKPERGRRGWICANPSCRCGTVLNRCHQCHTVIVKNFPQAEEPNSDNETWIRNNEVFQRDPVRRGARHCCSCGATT